MPTQTKPDLSPVNLTLKSVRQTLNSDPIAIFDSGVGGLSIAQCINQCLPNESLLYVADTLYAPYGDKSAALIQQRVNEIAQWFIQRHAKAIVVACNTATVNAIDQLRQQVLIPVIGVEPAIKPAASISKNKKVAILVTKATAENQRFLNLVKQYSQMSEVIVQPCPGLVELIEQNKKNSAQCQLLLTTYLQPLLDKGVDTIVLGCTHYPLIKNLISKICSSNITIMETARPVTEQLQRQLALHQLINPSNDIANIRFYSSNASEKQQVLFNNLWHQPIKLHSYP